MIYNAYGFSQSHSNPFRNVCFSSQTL